MCMCHWNGTGPSMEEIYVPSDDDYKKAEKKKLAVDPNQKLAATWANLKKY